MQGRLRRLAKSNRPGQHRIARKPEVVNRSIRQTSAEAHRRYDHPVYPRSVKPEFSPAFLAWICVAAHSRIGHPQIETGRGSRLGSVWLNWVCICQPTTPTPKAGRRGTPRMQFAGFGKRALRLQPCRSLRTHDAKANLGSRRTTRDASIVIPLNLLNDRIDTSFSERHSISFNPARHRRDQREPTRTARPAHVCRPSHIKFKVPAAVVIDRAPTKLAHARRPHFLYGPAFPSAGVSDRSF